MFFNLILFTKYTYLYFFIKSNGHVGILSLFYGIVFFYLSYCISAYCFRQAIYIFVFKYHLSCTYGKISVTIKIGITFIFKFHQRPVQLVAFLPVGLSSILRHLRQVLLGIEVSFVARPGQLTVGTPTTNGLHERTQLIEWDAGQT